MKLNVLFLSCANDKEADAITTTLLEEKLAFCIKKQPVSSSFLWKGKIENSKETLLIIESLEKDFNKINQKVASLHSYDTYVLVAVRVNKTTKKVERWIMGEQENNF